MAPIKENVFNKKQDYNSMLEEKYTNQDLIKSSKERNGSKITKWDSIIIDLACIAIPVAIAIVTAEVVIRLWV